MPDPNRAAPSQAFLIHDHTALIDCGCGSLAGIVAKKIKLPTVKYLFVTHTHADHCSQLPIFVLASYLQGRKEPIEIFGPPGIRQFCDVIFDQAFPYISRLIKARKGVEMDLRVHEHESGEILKTDLYTVSCGRVVHGEIPTLAFRLDFRKGSVTVSGDTAPCDSLTSLASNTDILVHECPFPDSHGEHPAHTIPKQLGQIARSAKPKKLILTHFFPVTKGREAEMVASVREHYNGEIIIATDGLEIDIASLF